MTEQKEHKGEPNREQPGEHIGDLELIGFSKGSLKDPDRLKSILSHLMQCEECRQQLRDIHLLATRFDEVFDALFPDPLAEITRWITQARRDADEWAIVALDRMTQKIREDCFDLNSRRITHVKTAAGTEKVGVSGTKEGEEGFFLMADEGVIDPLKVEIILKDIYLSLCYKENPGFKNAMLIGPGYTLRARLQEMGSSGFYYVFTLTVDPGTCLLLLY